MSKNTLILLAIVALLLVGGGGFMFLNRYQVNLQAPTSNTPNIPNISTMNRKSLKDLFMLSGDQQCTFFDKETGDSGAVYSKSGNVRGDFQSEVNGESTESHMIQDGKYIYFWMDGEEAGYKASLDKVMKMGDGAMEQYQSQSKSVDLKKQVDYSCSAWGGDSSKFVVPSNVEFSDYTSMMEEAGKMMEESGESGMMQDLDASCDVCDTLTGEAQMQCKAALKCN